MKSEKMHSKSATVSIIIPAFNEAATIQELLQRVWNQKIVFQDAELKKELIVVESNSSDGTREIVQAFVQAHPKQLNCEIQAILQEKPQGKGAAVRLGFARATGEIILIQDGDLEYDTQDYNSLIEPLLSQKCNFVLGSRHLSAGSWKIRQFEKNALKAGLFNFFGILLHGSFNILFGVRLTDPTTMYKVFRRSCLKDFTLHSNRFDFDLELAAKLIRAGHIPIEVPVSYQSRGFDQGKKVRFFYDGLLCLRALIRHRLTPLKQNQAMLAENISLPIDSSNTKRASLAKDLHS